MSTQLHMPTAPDVTQERDPVCGMKVRAETPHRTEYRGRTYRFCSAGCLAKFTADPERYLAPKPAPPRPTEGMETAEYTCPMHPEVISKTPGNCPKCGMKLVPKKDEHKH